MPLDALEQSVVESKIREMLDGHIAHPFETLRERGAVAQLFAALRGAVPFNRTITANLGPQKAGLKRRANRTVCVGRVQLEMTVRCCSEQHNVRKDVDLVVLDGCPTIVYGGQGEGDVLKQLDAKSIAAAVEVKASPSSLAAARRDYAKDILALLWLAESAKATAFFVLLDKFHTRFHAPSASDRQCMDGELRWWAREDGSRRGRGSHKTLPTSATDSPTSVADRYDILMEQERPQRTHVEVWSIWQGASGRPEPHVCYASLKPGGKNRHPQLNEHKCEAGIKKSHVALKAAPSATQDGKY